MSLLLFGSAIYTSTPLSAPEASPDIDATLAELKRDIVAMQPDNLYAFIAQWAGTFDTSFEINMHLNQPQPNTGLPPDETCAIDDPECGTVIDISWQHEVNAAAQDCEIEVRHSVDFTEEEFVHHYRSKKPVVILNYSLARSAHFADDVLTNYRNYTVLVGTGDSIVDGRGSGDFEVLLDTYMKRFIDADNSSADFEMFPQNDDANELPYVFDRNLSSELMQYISDEGLHKGVRADQLYTLMGPNQTGVGWHRHPDAFTTTLTGRKKWFFYHPNIVPPASWGERRSHHDWITHVLPNLPQKVRPFACTQPAGSTMYVPEMWWHQTQNLAPSIAISIQVII